MATYVKFELEDGTVVYFESTDVAKGSSGLLPAHRGDAAGQGALSFEKSVESISKMAAALVQNLREGHSEQPEEVQVNFGLKASGDVGGLIVSRGGAESNYNVMLRWRKPEEKKDEEA
jgi:hypothetical protein